jgi:hypothetical protein
LPDFEQRLNAFVDYHKKLKTRVVFVTVSYSMVLLLQVTEENNFIFRVAEPPFPLKTKPFVLLITLAVVRVVPLQQNTFWRLAMPLFSCIARIACSLIVETIHTLQRGFWIIWNQRTMDPSKVSHTRCVCCCLLSSK